MAPTSLDRADHGRTQTQDREYELEAPQLRLALACTSCTHDHFGVMCPFPARTSLSPTPVPPSHASQLTANDHFAVVPCLAAQQAFADTPATFSLRRVPRGSLPSLRRYPPTNHTPGTSGYPGFSVDPPLWHRLSASRQPRCLRPMALDQRPSSHPLLRSSIWHEPSFDESRGVPPPFPGLATLRSG